MSAIKRCPHARCGWGVDWTDEVDCPRCGTALVVEEPVHYFSISELGDSGVFRVSIYPVGGDAVCCFDVRGGFDAAVAAGRAEVDRVQQEAA